jgi:hypothetical protein
MERTAEPISIRKSEHKERKRETQERWEKRKDSRSGMKVEEFTNVRRTFLVFLDRLM